MKILLFFIISNTNVQKCTLKSKKYTLERKVLNVSFFLNYKNERFKRTDRAYLGKRRLLRPIKFETFKRSRFSQMHLYTHTHTLYTGWPCAHEARLGET